MIDTSKVYASKNYGLLCITKYVNSRNIHVKFISTGYATVVSAALIRSGQIKDKLMPNVCGVGFIGDGDIKPSINGKNTKSYIAWRSMMQRCYDAKVHKRCPTYIGCTVCGEWHNYQNFAQWYNDNYIKGYHLDKDIKIPGNKVYSPDACLFVSCQENNIKANAKHYEFISPKGEEVSIYNMTEFCLKNNLNQSHMMRVNAGLVRHHKQWTRSDIK